MRLSSKGRYGFRALFHIAYHSGGRPTQLREVSEEAAIPSRFLEQIFHELKRAGIVTAKRGPKGGYQLAKHPAEISLGDALRALEGAPAIADRLRGRDALDPVSLTLTELASGIERCFDAVSLADMILRAERAGVRRRRPDPSRADVGDYAI